MTPLLSSPEIRRAERVERWAVMVPSATMRGGEIAPVPDTNIPGTYGTRADTEWALGKIGEGRIVFLGEVRDDEEILPRALRHLANQTAYGDGWPRTARREYDERALFRAWDAACVATSLSRVDPPYETLRAFLQALHEAERHS